MTHSAAAPRVVRAEDLADIGAERLMDVVQAVMMILALPQAAADHVDALVVPTGQGEQWRFTHAIRSWEANPDLRCLLIANGNPAERTYTDLTLDYLRGLGLRRVAGVHIQPEPAPNTGRQAAWIAGQVRQHDLASIALVVSPYHLPRVYLTVLKTFDQQGIRLPIIPAPVTVAPDAPVPETGATGYDLAPGEVQRILAYTDAGWVADPQLLRRYLRWLWREHATLLGAL